MGLVRKVKGGANLRGLDLRVEAVLRLQVAISNLLTQILARETPESTKGADNQQCILLVIRKIRSQCHQ